MRHSHFTERDSQAGSQHLAGSNFPHTPRQDRACFILSLPTQPSSSFLQALLHPNPTAHNQGLGLLPEPYLAWGPQLSSSGPAALQGHMPSSFLECWLPLFPAWALFHFLLPLPCLSQTPLFGVQGGH